MLKSSRTSWYVATATHWPPGSTGWSSQVFSWDGVREDSCWERGTKMTGHHNVELIVTLPWGRHLLGCHLPDSDGKRTDVLWVLGSPLSGALGLDGCVCHVGGKEESRNAADFQLLGTTTLTSFADIQLNSMTTDHNKYVWSSFKSQWSSQPGNQSQIFDQNLTRKKRSFLVAKPQEIISCCSSSLVPISRHPQHTGSSLTPVLPRDNPVFLADLTEGLP